MKAKANLQFDTDDNINNTESVRTSKVGRTFWSLDRPAYYLFESSLYVISKIPTGRNLLMFQFSAVK
jgi:hypothetical protein